MKRRCIRSWQEHMELIGEETDELFDRKRKAEIALRAMDLLPQAIQEAVTRTGYVATYALEDYSRTKSIDKTIAIIDEEYRQFMKQKQDEMLCM